MAALTNMKGTLIANGGAISMGADGTLEGRMLSTTGEATVYNVTSAIPICSLIPLPIGLTSFSAQCDHHSTILSWSTQTENRNDYFTVEQSANGKNWATIGTVEGAGNSSSVRNYSLTDATTYDEINYYQLKQTDFNGRHTYANIIGIAPCIQSVSEHLKISPNPTTGTFRLNIDGLTSGIESIDIINSQGQIVYSTTELQSSFDLSGHAPGLYILRIKQQSKITSARFILSSATKN